MISDIIGVFFLSFVVVSIYFVINVVMGNLYSYYLDLVVILGISYRINWVFVFFLTHNGNKK